VLKKGEFQREGEVRTEALGEFWSAPTTSGTLSSIDWRAPCLKMCASAICTPRTRNWFWFSCFRGGNCFSTLMGPGAIQGVHHVNPCVSIWSAVDEGEFSCGALPTRQAACMPIEGTKQVVLRQGQGA
jgi:hypothetical protein